MLRDNLVELIEPMLNAGVHPSRAEHSHPVTASDDRFPCLENPRPKGAESSLTENVTSPFQAEPAQFGLVNWRVTDYWQIAAIVHWFDLQLTFLR
jgi:hypothetical protein